MIIQGGSVFSLGARRKREPVMGWPGGEPPTRGQTPPFWLFFVIVFVLVLVVSVVFRWDLV